MRRRLGDLYNRAYDFFNGDRRKITLWFDMIGIPLQEGDMMQPFTSKRQAMVGYVWEMCLGDFYVWGDEGPDQWDCSGLVSEALQAVGVFPYKLRLTADGIYKRLAETETRNLQPGNLAFFGSEDKKTHVEIIAWIDPETGEAFSIGARGGGRNTKGPNDARSQNAFVKMRPLRGYLVVCDPFKVIGL